MGWVISNPHTCCWRDRPILPIGILLAFGRRSSLPVVKAFSTAFIELIRGVPLITILFMFSLILQVFLPVGSRFDRLLRALIAITIFSAAYMAENIRGGLAAVPLKTGNVSQAKLNIYRHK